MLNFIFSPFRFSWRCIVFIFDSILAPIILFFDNFPWNAILVLVVFFSLTALIGPFNSALVTIPYAIGFPVLAKIASARCR